MNLIITEKNAKKVFETMENGERLINVAKLIDIIKLNNAAQQKYSILC